jgi:hypothetical protein
MEIPLEAGASSLLPLQFSVEASSFEALFSPWYQLALQPM